MDATSSEYIPHIWRVKKDSIYSAIHAIEVGIEHATQLLADHDASLGRTTLKNQTWAEKIEADIRHMKTTLAALKAEPQSRES